MVNLHDLPKPRVLQKSHHLTFSKCVIFSNASCFPPKPWYHIYRTFPAPKKIGFTVSPQCPTQFVSHPYGSHHDHGVGSLVASQHINADDAAGVGPCVVQLHLSFRWRLDRACARFRWIRESVLLVQKKGGERWKHLETAGWTDIWGVNCYPQTRRRGEKPWKQFIQKNSDKKIVHFRLFFSQGKLFL